MTSVVLFAGFGQAVYGILLFLTSLFLILLVLVQRGRGGGLSGAFGGMGGQSAFGAKAGDTFTKITIGAATFWIVLCLFGVKYIGGQAVASKFVDPVSAMEDSGEPAAEVQSEGDFSAPDSGLTPDADADVDVPPEGGSLSTGSESDS